MSHICDNLSERRNHDVRLCLCMPFSNVIFLVSRDLKCKWSVVESRAVSQLLHSTKIFLFVRCNESFLPSLGSEASWVVMWRGSFGMAHAAGPCGSADYLNSRNMWNNNDGKPADFFSNITPHDPWTIYPIQCWDGWLITVMLFLTR